MKDLLFLAVMGSILWIVYAVTSKRSIIPFIKTKKTKEKTGFVDQFNEAKAKTDEEEVYQEQDPDLFEELLEDVIDIKNHLVHLEGNRFVMYCEVQPCNYFLRSQEEQEAIDSAFEAWLATLNYPVQIYLQNRYVDLSEPIEEMRRNMMEQNDLPVNAIEYGKAMLEDLVRWQMAAPRYETKRYLVFPYEVNVNNIQAASKEEFAERVEERAWTELYRRYSNAKNMLRKANMDVQLLTTEGIIDLFYHQFNRKKALKNKFKNVRDHEMLSLYSTADQPQSRIEYVKELINENEKSV
jgi:hypothetical protein